MVNYLGNFKGTLATGTLAESFSHSLPMISSATPDVVAQSMVTALTSQWSAGVSPLSLHHPTAVSYTEVTVASIIDPLLGKVSVAYHLSFGTPLVGTGPGGALPSQNAIAVSYWARAARPNGGDIKSRFYLPTPDQEAVAPTDGTLVTGTRDNIRDKWAAILTQLSDAGHQPACWSRTLGIVVPAHDMRVGNKVDTIRRRRNAMPEVYAIGQISP